MAGRIQQAIEYNYWLKGHLQFSSDFCLCRSIDDEVEQGTNILMTDYIRHFWFGYHLKGMCNLSKMDKKY